MPSQRLFLCILSLSGVLASPGQCDVRLASVFGDHMVLQHSSEVTVWGWADPGEEISLDPSWPYPGSDGPHPTTATADGRWRVNFMTPGAGGPHTLTVRGKNEIVLKDVLMGEVWVCSGQSNMQWGVQQADNAQQEIAAANHPQLRLFQAQRAIAVAPADDISGAWSVCTPTTIPGFSATAYYFGRKLHSELGVPVGLISTNWGGTVVEAWTSAEALAAVGEFGDALSLLKDATVDSVGGASLDQLHQNYPTALYNGMIAPIIPFGIRGVIWYQGESNRTRAEQYRKLFPAMIQDWRTRWELGDFPFYFVQIAPYRYGNDTGEAAELREAQTMTLSLPNTGMCVTMDIGNPADIHPTNKQTVGARLARWALARDYGRDVVPSGPMYRTMVVVGDEARLHFGYADGGLSALGGVPTHFTVAGDDHVFHSATARIEGETVVVRSVAVPHPRAVRYAWGAADEPNLKNAAGLPAPSFRTDDWPMVTRDR